MNRPTLLMLLLVVHGTCFAQVQIPAVVAQEVTDPSLVIKDRGSKLEVLANKRATARKVSSGKSVLAVYAASKSQAINPQQLGVVFNHSLNLEAYITGQIAFKMKGELQADGDFDPLSYPGLTKLTNPNVYLVVASTPSEFVALVSRLKARTDLEWVEPIVTYGVDDPIR